MRVIHNNTAKLHVLVKQKSTQRDGSKQSDIGRPTTTLENRPSLELKQTSPGSRGNVLARRAPYQGSRAMLFSPAANHIIIDLKFPLVK
jgi:hypothetical protein